MDLNAHTPGHDTLLEMTADVLAGRKTLAEVTAVPKSFLIDLFNRAQNAYMAEDYAASENFFSMLLFLDKTDRRAMLGYAGSLEGQSRYTEALSMYLTMTLTTPFDPVAPFRAGICFLELKDTAQAIQSFRMAVACEQKMAGNPRKQVYVTKAQTLLKILESPGGNRKNHNTSPIP